MKSYQQRLQAELAEIWEANENPVAFAFKRGARGDEAYLRGVTKGWVQQCLKNAKLYAEILGNEALAAQLATPLEVVDA